MGVALNTVKQWEQGLAQPDLETLACLARLSDMALSKYLSLLDNVVPKAREPVYREPPQRKRRSRARADHLH